MTRFVSGFVGVSNVVERSGRRFTIRPEKVKLLDPGESAQGLTTERGVIRDVAYAGILTRYLVELALGGELLVVRQNLETSSAEELERRGHEVTVGWRPDQAVAIQEDEQEREASQ